MKEKVLIVGLGRSGFACARLMAGEADVTAWDSKEEKNFDPEELRSLRDIGVNLLFAEEPADHFDRVVLSPGVSPKLPMIQKLSAEGAFISGELEESASRCAGTFFAITGTNGKTTTTSLVGEMVKAAKIDCKVVGNIGLPVASEAAEAGPDTIMVTEVSSFQLETCTMFRPHVSCILNLTPDHLDRHGSFEEYVRVKELIYSNQFDQDYFIYNDNDPLLRQAAEDAPCEAIPFSSENELKKGAFVKGGEIVIADDGMVSLCGVSELQIPGKHNLENALAAAAVAYFGGIPCEAISEALRSFKGVEHRIEFVREIDGVRYINDSKGTNPDASIKAVESVKAPVILIAGGYEKNSDFTEFIRSFNGRVRDIILIGATAKRFFECAAENGFPKENMHFAPDMKACVETAHKLAVSGDTVLLSSASASWDMYKSFEERGNEFKKLVNSIK